MEFETAVHALWECAMLHEIWDAVLVFEDRRQYAISNTRDLISVFQEKKKKKKLGIRGYGDVDDLASTQLALS